MVISNLHPLEENALFTVVDDIFARMLLPKFVTVLGVNVDDNEVML